MSRIQLAICYVFLTAGLLIALCSAAHRVQADRDYTRVIVLLDWHALNALPPAGDVSQLSVSGLSAELLDPGTVELISSFPGAQVCYGEETIGTLLAQGIIQRAWLTTGGPAFVVVDERFAGDIASGASRHGYLYENSAGTDGRLMFIAPDLPEEDLMLVPVAWLRGIVSALKEAGVHVVLRPGGSEYMGEGGIRRTLDFCEDQRLMLFQGPTVLGYPGQLKLVAGLLKGRNQQFGWVEFDEQDGGAQLAAQLAPGVVRVHSIPPEEMVNYASDTATARYVRAVRERGIRCLYVRPFIRGAAADSNIDLGYRDELARYNHDYFYGLKTALGDAGFEITRTILPPGDRAAWLGMVQPLTLTLAVGAVGILLFAMWLPGWPRWVWWLFIALAAVKGIAAVFMPMVETAVLLAAALFFPLWGLWWAMILYQRLTARIGCAMLCPRRIFIAMLALVVASLASIAGGLLIHGAMWDAATMIKVGQFRGVTLALAIPVLVFAAYAWQAETLQDAYDTVRGALQDYWQRFIQLWQSPIRYGDVAFIMIALGAVAIVLLRSGNDSPLEILSVETWFRGSLEDWFAVRPRTKELIGHPLLVLFLLSIPWRTRLSLLFGLGALLGQVSILNTFCHLHTPLMVTVTRVLLGLGLGLATGLVWGVVVVIVGRLWGFVRSRFSPESS
jgi:hypothetical protein